MTDITDVADRPTLPDGLVAVVKRSARRARPWCPSCRTSPREPPSRSTPRTTPSFPGDPGATHDADLAVSWHNEIETVPTLIVRRDGAEVERTVGWSRDEWRRITGLEDLGGDLPPMRPGCGSMSVDPDLVDELRVRFAGETLHSRRIDVAAAEDDMEMMYARGWTDGLPVVPPTPERVMAMLEGTDRDASDVVAIVPPTSSSARWRRSRSRR